MISVLPVCKAQKIQRERERVNGTSQRQQYIRSYAEQKDLYTLYYSARIPTGKFWTVLSTFVCLVVVSSAFLSVFLCDSCALSRFLVFSSFLYLIWECLCKRNICSCAVFAVFSCAKNFCRFC